MATTRAIAAAAIIKTTSTRALASGETPSQRIVPKSRAVAAVSTNRPRILNCRRRLGESGWQGRWQRWQGQALAGSRWQGQACTINYN